MEKSPHNQRFKFVFLYLMDACENKKKEGEKCDCVVQELKN